MTAGIDVSNWQGAPDWDAVARSGYLFGFAKVSESTTFRDPQFSRNWDELQRVGMVRGAYHFCQPDLNTPAAEADWLMRNLPPLTAGDLVVVDGEAGNGNTATWYLGLLLSLSERLGFAPIFYTGRWYTDAHGITGDARFAQFRLWLAAYQAQAPLPPAPWDFWALWQQSASGTVPGVAGKCDLNLFNGTVEQLRAYGKPAAPAQREPTNSDLVYMSKLLYSEPPQLTVLHNTLTQFTGVPNAIAPHRPEPAGDAGRVRRRPATRPAATTAES